MYCINYLPRSLCFFGTSVHFASEACTRLSSAQPVCCRPGRPRAPGTASRSPGHCGSPAGEAGPSWLGQAHPWPRSQTGRGKCQGDGRARHVSPPARWPALTETARERVLRGQARQSCLGTAPSERAVTVATVTTCRLWQVWERS